MEIASTVKKTANSTVLWLESRIGDTLFLSIIVMHRGTKYLVPFQNSNHSFSLAFCWASILQVYLLFPFIKNDIASMTDKLQEEIQALMCDKTIEKNPISAENISCVTQCEHLKSSSMYSLQENPHIHERTSHRMQIN